MISGLRGLASVFVRSAVRIGMTVQSTYWTIKDIALGYLESEVYIDYEKFARQDWIVGEVGAQRQDFLIAGDLHEESVWKLSKKYRYEVDTPFTTASGESVIQTTTVTSSVRLTPEEILTRAEPDIDKYMPEGATLSGPQTISSVWRA